MKGGDPSPLKGGGDPACRCPAKPKQAPGAEVSWRLGSAATRRQQQPAAPSPCPGRPPATSEDRKVGGSPPNTHGHIHPSPPADPGQPPPTLVAGAVAAGSGAGCEEREEEAKFPEQSPGWAAPHGGRQSGVLLQGPGCQVLQRHPPPAGPPLASASTEHPPARRAALARAHASAAKLGPRRAAQAAPPLPCPAPRAAPPAPGSRGWGWPGGHASPAPGIARRLPPSERGGLGPGNALAAARAGLAPPQPLRSGEGRRARVCACVRGGEGKSFPAWKRLAARRSNAACSALEGVS